MSANNLNLFYAHFGDEDIQNKHINFTAAPPCQAIEGELLQDVTLNCSRNCRALVLHKAGAQLSSCPLPGLAKAYTRTPAYPAGPIGPHLNLASIMDPIVTRGAKTNELVKSIALAARCHKGGGHHCAYVQTNKRRILELQSGLEDGNGDGSPDWYPTRMLKANMTGRKFGPILAGGLHLIGGEFLGLLLPNKREFELLDPEDSQVIGRWHLPEVAKWGAMCSTGESLYFLAEGDAPQIWRFPMPAPYMGKPRPSRMRAHPSIFLHPTERALSANFHAARPSALQSTARRAVRAMAHRASHLNPDVKP